MQAIRISQGNLRYVLCVGFRKEIGLKFSRPEPFLFFSPELPTQRDEESVMLHLAETLTTRFTGRTYILVGAKKCSFAQFSDILFTQIEFADAFGGEEWQENLKTLSRQGRSVLLRLNGGAPVPRDPKPDWKNYHSVKAAEKKSVPVPKHKKKKKVVVKRRVSLGKKRHASR